ncbi:DNA cytosine methyltransferase [Methanobrevibacter curvatus]|uniref:DNA (cytosine-5-)-methyltransferase n=1 Tax=Methanobrevibacter curvatus TaxID=49547 RepID=A0A162FNW4_9EURY|nr:DNA cytosine methyltransferase [Methanobrevibacter curvatus]KZX12880.1 modification methylase AplI [Methanobrevibacter curvatus]
MNRKPKVIDLFCGIGGFSKGFEMAGFEVVLGIDNWNPALDTFKKNHNNTEILNQDICEIDDKFYKKFSSKIDVIIAGPPCQGFSMCGTRDVNDNRNRLFKEVIRAVNIINPKIVVIENVVGLMSMKTPDGYFVKDIIANEFEKLGYVVNNKILDASDYNVPQSRKRVFFIASKIGTVRFPKKSSNTINVFDALSNVPDTNNKHYLPPKNKFQQLMKSSENIIYNHDAMKHNKEVLRRILNVPQGGNWKDIPPEIYNVGGNHSNNYRRLNPNKPSITIKHATKSMIIHYEYNRVITAREAARLQSFSDSFIILGNRTDQQQQLANAVPPFLGFVIGKQILNKLKGKKEKIQIQSTLSNFN